MDTRLPLQVGTSCLWALAWASATLIPGALLVAVGVSAWSDPAAEGGGVAVLVGGLAILYGVLAARRAWRTRPSDARLARDALTIEGGLRSGLRIAWSDLDPARTRAETRPARRLSASRLLASLGASISSNELELALEREVPVRRLHLVTRAGVETILAEAEHPAEQRSLDALLGSIQAMVAGDEAPAPALPPEVLGCPGCGAPLRPVDAATIACDRCGREVAVPPTIRERTRAALQVRAGEAAIEASAATLLGQPSARWAATWLALCGAIAALVWVMIAIGSVAAGLSSIGGFEIGWGLVAGWAMALVALVLGRAALASRRALRLLASSFGARAPARGGEAPACRRCGAPLPPTEGLVSGCVFCGADNLLGLDLRRRVAPTEEHALSLRAVVEARDRERRRWRLAALAMLPVAGLAAIMALTSYVVGLEFRDELARCEAGEAQACYEVAVDYRLGISVAEDDARALTFAARACDLDHAEACYDLGEILHWGWDVAEDPARAEALRLRACALGHAKACSPYTL